jgi:hypothetical protein
LPGWTTAATVVSLGLSLRVFWEFGAPGHGKGVWDGIGALIKRTVRQDIIDDQPRRKSILTDSGRISTAKEVAEHVFKRFDEKWTAKQMHKALNEIVVIYVDTEEIVATRPKPEHENQPLVGMQKTFSYMALGDGVAAQRSFSCWCEACMRVFGRGGGGMDSNLVVAACTRGQPWREVSVQRSDASGIANARARARVTAKRCAEQLQRALTASPNEPVWVAVQNRGEVDDDQYWIGRATSIMQTFKESGSVSGTGGRVRYDAGDMQIAVQWVDRTDVDSERRTFELWEPPRGAEAPATFSFNSSELRKVKVEMVSVPPVRAAMRVVARERRVAATVADASRRANAAVVRRAVHATIAPLPAARWIIPVAEENIILDRCCSQ